MYKKLWLYLKSIDDKNLTKLSTYYQTKQMLFALENIIILHDHYPKGNGTVTFSLTKCLYKNLLLRHYVQLLSKPLMIKIQLNNYQTKQRS